MLRVCLIVSTLVLAGCGRSPDPAAQREAFEKEQEMLNEHRNREWSNE